MTNEFPRNVAGYNIPRIPYNAGYAGQGLPLVINITNGPGEIIGICILKTSGADADFFDLYCKIEVDGYVYYDNVWRDLVLFNTAYNAHGHFGTHDIQVANQYSSSSFYCRMSYEASFKVTFYKIAGNPVYLFYTVPYRYAG